MPETYLVLGTPGRVTEVAVTFSSFPDGDIHCLINEVDGIENKSVLIVHRLYPNQNEQILRLIFLIDLLKDLGVSDVSVFCPYLPYSRQDKRHVAGEALGAYTICHMLASAGCKQLYTIDCHFMRGKLVGTYKGLSVSNVPAADMLLDVCQQMHVKNKEFLIIGPDEGSSFLTRHIGKLHMKKERGTYSHNGSIRHREVTKLEASHLSFSQETVILVDDIVSTGTTMIRAVQQLKEHGISDIYCLATHGLFLANCYNELARLTKAILTSDSIERDGALPLTASILKKTVIPTWQARAISCST